MFYLFSVNGFIWDCVCLLNLSEGRSEFDKVLIFLLDVLLCHVLSWFKSPQEFGILNSLLARRESIV